MTSILTMWVEQGYLPHILEIISTHSSNRAHEMAFKKFLAEEAHWDYQAVILRATLNLLEKGPKRKEQQAESS